MPRYRRRRRGFKRRHVDVFPEEQPPALQPMCEEEEGEEEEQRSDGEFVTIGGLTVPVVEPLAPYKAQAGDVHYYVSGRRFRQSVDRPSADEGAASPREHIRVSRAQKHPHEGTPPLPTTLQTAIKRAVELEEELPARRTDICAKLSEVARTLEVLKDEWGKELPVCCRRLHLPFMEYLARVTEYPDWRCVEELKEQGGLAFVGPLEAKGNFAAKETGSHEDVTNLEEFERFTQDRLRAMMGSVKDATENEKWMWEEAIKECEKGRLDGPYSIQEMLGWKACGATTRHVVVQPGKLRPCDDYRRSRVNSLIDVAHKVTLPELDTTRSVVEEVWRHYGRPVKLQLWKRDHRDAYRQVPLRSSERGFTTVLLRDPETGTLQGFRHRVFPFGAVSSVTGYLRLGMMITHCMRVMFACGLQSYLDDFYALEPRSVIQSSFDAFGVLNRLLGVEIKEEKDVSPTCRAKVLGIVIDVEEETEVRFELDENRRAQLMATVRHALMEGFPEGASGRKLAGRLSFACSTFSGRCGRAYVRTLIREGFRRGLPSKAQRKEVKGALRGIFRLLGSGRSSHRGRVVRFTSEPQEKEPKHVVVYADATGDGVIGGVATAADGKEVWYTESVVPEWYKIGLESRKQQVVAYELYAVAEAIATFCTDRRRDYVVFTDAEAVRLMLKRGSSGASDINDVAGRIWEHLADERISVYFQRVSSSANPADAPSRREKVPASWREIQAVMPTYLV